MAETSLGILPTPASYPMQTTEIARKLTEVEILYVLACKPKTLSELAAQMETTFGLETMDGMVTENLLTLKSRKFVRSFSNQPIANQSDSNDFAFESFSITPLGLSILGQWIESLSEITLTMQLGLHQRVAIVNE